MDSIGVAPHGIGSAAEKPILGICLGAQLLARALGGEVGPAVDPEFGWFEVDDVPEGGNRWGLPTRFTPLHWHSETFSIPPNATRLAETCALANQAFSLENALGLQFHLEVTTASVQALVDASRADLEIPGPFVQTESELVRSPTKRTFENLNEIAFGVLDRLADSATRE